MAYSVTLIPGDGTGPEVVEATRRVLEATGVTFTWDVQRAGADVLAEQGTPLPEEVLDSIRTNGVGLKGPITTAFGSGFRSVNVAIRQTLDLYANLRPAKTIPGVRSRYENIDLVVVRENTEDLYAGIEHWVIPGEAAESVKLITRAKSERIVRFAFDYARRHGRNKVTAVHKANVLKFTDGLFLQVAGEVAQEYPDIEFENRIVDNMCMQLVQKPELYDVLVCPNLYGDIVSDLTAGLIGGLGVAPGANIGEGLAVFDVKFMEKPTKISSEYKDFWGGYKIESKVIPHTTYSDNADNIDSLRRKATVVGPRNKKTFNIDISKFEYCLGV